MRGMLLRIAVAAVVCGVPVAANAHFPELIPSAPSMQADDPAILSVAIDRPGDYTVVIEPEPYWEPAEDSYLTVLNMARDSGIRVASEVLIDERPAADESFVIRTIKADGDGIFSQRHAHRRRVGIRGAQRKREATSPTGLVAGGGGTRGTDLGERGITTVAARSR